MKNQLLAATLLAALTSVTAAGQQPAATPAQVQKPAEQSAAASSPLTPLRVGVVITRFQGDKKTTSLPYTLSVVANSDPTTLRLGVEVPIATSRPKSPDGSVVIPSFSYRTVGSNIDCRAWQMSGGFYNLKFVVEDSSVQIAGGEKTTALAEEMPSFRSFKVSFNAIMRDGQTTQHTSATDPITGEVMRVEVTLNVAK